MSSEIDIFIPSLKLGIEINGILHYEPIYGEDKLNKIINNDKAKIIACYEVGVELAVLAYTDTYLSEKVKQKYWSFVKNLICDQLL
jgi:hypothetical protein